MSLIPQSTVDQIYASIDIVEVIGAFVQLKKKGGNHFGLSPFTNEKTPSFAVSQAKGIWKDFSTGKGGSAPSFLMESQGMTYRESLVYLAELYKIDIPKDDAQVDQAPDNRDALKILTARAASTFEQQLAPSGEAQTYLLNRGLSIETIKKFNLGYAPAQWEWLGPRLIQEGYSRDLLIASGLVFEADATKITDRFRGRIMFPICDHFGKPIAFGGRIFGDGKGAKYINSPASEIYDKSRVLYGLHLARKSITELDQAILTEGYLDVIMLHQSGQGNAIASCGTALTKDQCQLIRRYTRNVLIIRDSDKAGLAAMVKDIAILLTEGMYPSALPLPQGEDPDSYCRKYGADGFAAHKAKSTKGFVDALFGILRKGHDMQQPQALAAVVAEVCAILKAIPDPVLLHTSLQRLASLSGIPVEVVMQSAGMKVQNHHRNTPVANDLPVALPSMHAHEIGLLTLLANHGTELVDGEIVGAILIGTLTEYPLTSLSPEFALIADRLCKTDRFAPSDLLQIDGMAPIIGRLLHIDGALIDPNQIDSILRDFQRHHLECLMNECRTAMKESTDPVAKESYLNKYASLVRMMKAI